MDEGNLRLHVAFLISKHIYRAKAKQRILKIMVLRYPSFKKVYHFTIEKRISKYVFQIKKKCKAKTTYSRASIIRTLFIRKIVYPNLKSEYQNFETLNSYRIDLIVYPNDQLSEQKACPPSCSDNRCSTVPLA